MISKFEVTVKSKYVMDVFKSFAISPLMYREAVQGGQNMQMNSILFYFLHIMGSLKTI